MDKNKKDNTINQNTNYIQLYDILDGKYYLLKKLGDGLTSDVYLAERIVNNLDPNFTKRIKSNQDNKI